ncbi:8238_t:CDS:2 [Gigaspora rosea]|nr:8238_t:CDS:2 [Gigaspora rosea]
MAMYEEARFATVWNIERTIMETFSLFKPQFREAFEPELLAALQRYSGGLQSTQKDADLTKS